jgi:hypothetical protein
LAATCHGRIDNVVETQVPLEKRINTPRELYRSTAVFRQMLWRRLGISGLVYDDPL